MSTTEIKKNLIKKIDSLSGRHLREVNSMVTTYVRNKTVLWENLEGDEKAAIEEGLKQLDKGMGIPHEKVMMRIRKKIFK